MLHCDGVSSPSSQGVAFIKRVAVSTLDEAQPIGSQIQVRPLLLLQLLLLLLVLLLRLTT